jgi:hydrogenase maturation protein HypF
MLRDIMKKHLQPSSHVRVKVALRGAVQGVGFRPFVHRLATELALTGWVNNSSQGVFLEAESERPALEQFLHRLQSEKPAPSFIQSMETTWLDAVGFNNFEIRASEAKGEKTALVLPDIATCPDCLHEIFDPTNRRFRYPFTNCTNCGPRFSIIESLPYDRANTTMKQFAMCPACQAEYDDPHNRRFHAQPNACPICGPHLEFWNVAADVFFSDSEPLQAAADMIREGRIVAVKGVGGFHMLVDARNEQAVQLLRERKCREEKPFALLFPTLDKVSSVCHMSPLEERLLRSSEAPIVLLQKISHHRSPIANSVAPSNPNLGVMLPSNPIQHLLMAELGFPVVATSGNLSDEPICIDELEAVKRLRGIADFFLVHNRPIVRHVDDSIVRVMLGREMILRRARGFAPLPIPIPGVSKAKMPGHQGNSKPHHDNCCEAILAVGAHLKNSVALAVGKNIFISQHIGDLETEPADNAFRRVIADFQKLYEAKPQIVAADLHPDYLSTQFARQCGMKFLGVQHHVAHVLSCIAENKIELPALGVAWDGTGYGTDGTIWGGEFFVVTNESVERVASLRPFRLPGSNAAVKEPRRAALGMLFEMFGDAVFEKQDLAPVAAFSTEELTLLKTMLNRGLNSPKTTSVGRLFDAVASIVNMRQQMRFEGQAAMELEFASAGVACDKRYTLPLAARQDLCVLDWAPLMQQLLSDLQNNVTIGEISAKFHNALAEAIVMVALRFGHVRIALSGGCFQNRYLLERTVTRLRAEKFRPYWHQRVPTNDGGVALGQVMAALRVKKS